MNGLLFFGVKPNLFIIYILFLGLFFRKKGGFILGVILGLFLDLFIGRKLGINAMVLGIIGLIAERLDKSFSKESRMTLMLMTIFVTFIGELLYLAFQLLEGIQVEIIYLIKTISIEMLYNAILVIILYPIIQRLGPKIEEDFNSDKTFIKYY